MQVPLQVTFRHMDTSPTLEARIRARAAELEQFTSRITSCHVTVEKLTRRHRQGDLFEVRIDLVTPGQEIVIGRDRGLNHAHEDAHVAVRDAFDALRRQLQDHVRESRGEGKLHAVPDHGRVVRLMPDYGFVATSVGDEIYFHRNSVAGGGFDKLDVGAEVRFVRQDTEGVEGPQASTVIPIGKHHLSPVDTSRK